MFGSSWQAFLGHLNRRSFTLAPVFLVTILSDGNVRAVSLTSKETKLLETLAVYSNAESAACLGSLGMDLGLGLRTIEYSPNKEGGILFEKFTDNPEEINQSLVSINKGLPWPMDIGSTVGTFGNGVSHGGAHLKWTLFQHFQYPSAAFRTSYNQLWGLDGIKVYQYSADLLVSYAFGRFIELTGGYRSAQQTLERLRDDGVNDQIISNISIISSSINLTILPPVLSVSLERQLIQDYSSYLIRISFSS